MNTQTHRERRFRSWAESVVMATIDAPVHFCHTLAMQVWTKLAIGFMTTAIVIVSVYGGYQLLKEQADLRAAAEHDIRLTGTAVQVAVGNALRDRQPADVRDIIAAVKLRDASLDVLVFDTAGALIAGSWGASRKDDVVRQSVGEAQATTRAVVRFEGPRALSSLIAAFPIRDGNGQNVGAVALVRPLDELRRDFESEVRSTILSLVTLVIGLAVAGWILASVYVRRPVLDLVRTMRAVRAGNMAAKASFRRADELGTAVAEFNAMMGDLDDARRRLIAEAESREALEAKLQRADKLVTVGQLSAGLAHEIGSPLQVLNGRARALAMRTDVPAEVRRSAGILANESDRITRIVEQLLTFSRQTVPTIAQTQLGTPVRDIVDLVEAEARRHDVRIEFQCNEPLPPADADVGRVQQVVMNLLSNAVRATPSGGRVRVGLSSGTFMRSTGESQPSVSLTVEDTGEGIPEALVPHIFEPFFTTRSHAGGTGLGLAVVKAIVDAHGGAISVTSHPERGTRFTVHFPVAASAAAGGRVA
jgi:signal transduction histidine kinase